MIDMVSFLPAALGPPTVASHPRSSFRSRFNRRPGWPLGRWTWPPWSCVSADANSVVCAAFQDGSQGTPPVGVRPLQGGSEVRAQELHPFRGTEDAQSSARHARRLGSFLKPRPRRELAGTPQEPPPMHRPFTPQSYPPLHHFNLGLPPCIAVQPKVAAPSWPARSDPPLSAPCAPTPG